MAARKRKDAPKMCTLPETNQNSPENRPSQKESGLLTNHFQEATTLNDVSSDMAISSKAMNPPFLGDVLVSGRLLLWLQQLHRQRMPPLFVAVRAKRPRRPEIQKFMKKYI